MRRECKGCIFFQAEDGIRDIGVTGVQTCALPIFKIVHDALVEMLGAESVELALNVAPPAVIMMVGLQGSGKTTTTAKLAKRLSEKERKRVLMASLDVARPAAQEQLAVLGRQANVDTLPIVAGQQPVDIAKRAIQSAKLQAYDVVLLDTAGRLHVDDQLMSEMKAVASASSPAETLLVVDALTGQDAVNVAKGFSAEVPLTGVILRSEEHTSELQSRQYIVCRLLLEKKKNLSYHLIE